MGNSLTVADNGPHRYFPLSITVTSSNLVLCFRALFVGFGCSCFS